MWSSTQMHAGSPPQQPSHDDSETGVRKRTASFLPAQAVTAMLRAQQAKLDPPVLQIDGARSQLVLEPAVRILCPEGRKTDPFGMTGRVLALTTLLQEGATVTSEFVRFGGLTYHAELGYIAYRYEREADGPKR